MPITLFFHKKQYTNRSLIIMNKYFVIIVSALSLLTGCQQIDLGDDDGLDKGDMEGIYKIKLTSKSGVEGLDIPSPMTVYAVSDGKVVSQKPITESITSIPLPPGQYNLYAIAGAEAGNSSVPTENVVTMTEGYMMTPLLYGTKDTKISTKDVSATLTMKYAVASVDVQLSDMPSDVKSVVAEIGTQSSDMTITKAYSGQSTATLECTKQVDGTWKSNTVYVYPSAGTANTLKITQTNNADVVTSYTVKISAINAGTPYHFSGSYLDNKTLSMEITTEGWGADVNNDFVFGPAVPEENTESGENNNSSTGDGETFIVSSLPTAGSIWNGHVVALMEGNQGLLISLNETTGLKKTSDLASIATTYSEDGITGWSIPTLEQATKLCELYGGISFTNLRSLVESLGGTTLDFSQEPNYFYNDASSLFSFYSTLIKTAVVGTKTSYRLRLVKPVTFVVK